jgi:hypothetical protein
MREFCQPIYTFEEPNLCVLLDFIMLQQLKAKFNTQRHTTIDSGTIQMMFHNHSDVLLVLTTFLVVLCRKRPFLRYFGPFQVGLRCIREVLRVVYIATAKGGSSLVIWTSYFHFSYLCCSHMAAQRPCVSRRG